MKQVIKQQDFKTRFIKNSKETKLKYLKSYFKAEKHQTVTVFIITFGYFPSNFVLFLHLWYLGKYIHFHSKKFGQKAIYFFCVFVRKLLVANSELQKANGNTTKFLQSSKKWNDKYS